MTTPESTINENIENAFSAPEAELVDSSLNKPILEMKRFTAWGVFGLSVITLGFYGIYWLYSRASRLNSLASNKFNINLLHAYIVVYILSTALSFSSSESLTLISSILSVASFVFYIISVYGIRAVLSEVINTGSQEQVTIGGIKTFFFSTIYFQYKINEAIDAQGESQE